MLMGGGGDGGVEGGGLVVACLVNVASVLGHLGSVAG